MKLYLDAAIFIDEDLLAGRAGYNRGLETCDHGLRYRLLRPVTQAVRNTREAVFVRKQSGLLAAIVRLPSGMFDSGQQILVVGVEMPLQYELLAGREMPAVAGPLNVDALDLFLLHADSSRPRAVRGVVVEVLRL